MFEQQHIRRISTSYLSSQPLINQQFISYLPQIIVVMGLQGSGKSTVARLLSTALNNAPVLRTDALRNSVLRHLFPYKKIAELSAEEKYSLHARAAVYQALFKQAIELGSHGTVILDATFSNGRLRTQLEVLVAETKKPVVELHYVYVSSSDSTAEMRMRKRLKQGTDQSEAAATERRAEKTQFTPLAEPYLKVVNNGTLNHLSQVIYTLIG